ncbi:hypothetical protein NBRC116493_05680 [Aurantivibrio infirmus]
MNRVKVLTLAIALTSVVGVTGAMAAKSYYKWTDEDGVTHYSAQKPHDKESEKISVSTGLPTPTSTEGQKIPAKTTASDPAPALPKKDYVRAKDPERCAAATERLKTLTDYERVRVVGENGEARILSKEEKAEKTAEAKQAIEEDC